MNNHLSITNPLYLAKNTPIEVKSRITSLANLTDITYPWIGMKFYSVSEDKWYEVRTLKHGYLDYSTGSLTDVRPAGSEFVNFEIVPNLYIDTYRDDTSGQGQDGVGIDSILKTGGEGNYDIYTVTLTDGRTYEIRVRQGVDGQDGRGITSVTLVDTVNLIKTYEILFTDDSTFRFEVKDGEDGSDGRGVVSITKNPVVGSLHTWTVTYTDGTTSLLEIDVPSSGGVANPDNDWLSLNDENQLTLADKPTLSGEPYKIKHLKKGDTILDVISDQNTKYIIKESYDLQGQTLTIPKNVILEFQGGVISNGTLIGNMTQIIANRVLIFRDVAISKLGTWDVEKAYSHWFDCAKDGYIIDYKTMLEYYYDNIVTNITTAQEPLLPDDGLPIVSRNTTTGKWKIGSTDTNLRYLLAETIPTLKLAEDGISYLFDNYEKLQYIYNGVRYDVGHLTETEYVDGNFVTRKPDLSTFTDDTFKLNQLMNLKALHTTVGNEGDVFMIKPIVGNLDWSNIDDDYQGLVIGNVNNRILEINGILKCIPNNLEAYHVLVGNNCKNLKINGVGGVHGDIQEHLFQVSDNDVWYDSGEGGMCIHVAGCEGLLIQGLKLHNAWGDNIFPSWNRVNSSSNDTDFMKFLENDIACARRTGIGYEKGDFAEFRRNKFSGHRNRRGIATFAGIDIEPFNYADTPVRYCRNLIFDNNTFSEYRQWSALRLERCIGAQITNNYFTKNNADIHLLQCYIADEDVTATIPLGGDRRFVFGGVVIQNNTSEDSVAFVGSYGSSIAYRNKLYMADNIVKGAQAVLSNIYLTEATIERNTVFRLGQSFLNFVNGEYVTINNHIMHHYSNPLIGNNRVIIWYGGTMTDSTSAFVNGGNIDYLTVNNLKIKDLSPLADGKYLTDGSFIENGAENDYGRELINDRMSYTGQMFNGFTGKKLVVKNVTTDVVNFDVNSILSAYCNVDVLEYSNEYDSEDLQHIEKLIVGDVININNQKGRVAKGAFINPPKHGKLFVKDITPTFTAEAQTPLYNSDLTKYCIKNHNYGLAQQIYPSDDIWNPDASIIARFTYFDNPKPVILWEGVGSVDNILDVTLYNSNGQRVYEVSTGITWQWKDGAFFNENANLIGSSADRPADNSIYVGFKYYNTDLNDYEIFTGTTWV